MTPNQLQLAVRHLKGLLKVLQDENKAEIQLKEHMVYYDNKGNIIDIKIVGGLDFIEKIM